MALDQSLEAQSLANSTRSEVAGAMGTWGARIRGEVVVVFSSERAIWGVEM